MKYILTVILVIKGPMFFQHEENGLTACVPVIRFDIEKGKIVEESNICWDVPMALRLQSAT